MPHYNYSHSGTATASGRLPDSLQFFFRTLPPPAQQWVTKLLQCWAWWGRGTMACIRKLQYGHFCRLFPSPRKNE